MGSWAGGYASVNLGKPSLFRLPRFATSCNERGLEHNPGMKPKPLIHGEDSTSYTAVEHVTFTRMNRDSIPPRTLHGRSKVVHPS